jgi:hypothetical protein
LFGPGIDRRAIFESLGMAAGPESGGLSAPKPDLDAVSPKLRLVRQAILGLTWDFAGLAG